ncbi:MAG: beta-galactosidase, partial [Gemmatimonadota bacterium]|nr:beta-galactosidase [Gemmatimonadota bacterium]
MWTLPHRGSELRRRVDFLLNWTDRNGMGVWLMHNIQYGNPGEAGDIEAAFGDPAGYVKPAVDPWVDAIRGHPSVHGVQLGNEVEPRVPDGRTSPRYLAGFRRYLAESHGTIGNLNERWGTRYRGFGEISLPGARDPGHADLQRYARREFGRFYGSIFDQLFKPVLGRSLGYTVKTAADPFL